jgi:hypothetical protein
MAHQYLHIFDGHRTQELCDMDKAKARQLMLCATDVQTGIVQVTPINDGKVVECFQVSVGVCVCVFVFS